MTKFFFISKIFYFWYIFGPFPQFFAEKFFQKILAVTHNFKSDCHAQLHKSFYHHAKILRNLMIQFQENAQTDGKTEG